MILLANSKHLLLFNIMIWFVILKFYHSNFSTIAYNTHNTTATVYYNIGVKMVCFCNDFWLLLYNIIQCMRIGFYL